MGLLDLLKVGQSTTNLLSDAAKLHIASPWASTESLAPMVIADILGDTLSNLPVTRAEAMTVPAVAKARNLLVSTIAKFPLVAMKGDTRLTSQPSFLYRTDSNVTPYERMAWTVDSLIFHGVALWLVERGAPDADGRRNILRAEYCPSDYWSIQDGNILVNNTPVDESQVILFNAPFEGLLTIASRTIRGAIDQEAAWTGRARNPIPLIELHMIDDQLTQAEVREFVASWSTARRSENGAIGYTPPNLEIRAHGNVQADLMVEGRNAIRTDVGSFLNVRASMLDGTMGVDSLTYTTTQGEKNAFYEFDLPFWTDPIEARLSADDVVPRGQRVRFDKYDAYNLPTPTGIPTED